MKEALAPYLFLAVLGISIFFVKTCAEGINEGELVRQEHKCFELTQEKKCFRGLR